jgi:uncharacterized membrane-anchored protein YitT (DUF2179 family)
MGSIFTTKLFIAKQAVLIALGALVCALGINVFLVPHHFLTGGVSGLAILLSYLTPLNVGILVFLFNIPIFILGYRTVGKKFMLGSLWGTVLFSVFLEGTTWTADLMLTGQPLIAAIFGGALVGAGIGFAFRGNGSLGGPDIIAAAVRVKWSTSIGTVTFIFNTGIVIAGGILFGMEIALATIVGLAVQAVLSDKVIAGFDESKALFIMSAEHQKIADYIIRKLNRGVTYLEGEGAFLHQRRRVVYAVVTLPQLSRVKYFVRSVDPNAFLVVADVTEVQGAGFKAVPI